MKNSWSMIAFLLFNASCFAQMPRIDLITSVRGSGISTMWTAGNVKSTTQGVCVSLGIRHSDSLDERYDSSFVLCIRTDGVRRVELGEFAVVQSVYWNERLYSIVRNHPSSLVVESKLDTLDHRGLDMNGASRGKLPVSLSCLGGTIAAYDLANGVYVWVDPRAVATYLEVPYAYYTGVFAQDTDIYASDSHSYYVAKPPSLRMNILDGCGGNGFPLFNVSVVGDSVKWVSANNEVTSLSLSGSSVTCEKSYLKCQRVCYAGAYGALSVTPQGANIVGDQNGLQEFVLKYTGLSGSFDDTVRLPNIRSVANGLAWWDGGFYFTAEVRDSGAPYESTKTFLYKYTEPIPVVSVEDQLPTRTYSQLAERLAFTQDAYANWRDGLGAEVAVYDLLGNEVRGFVVPRPGVYCVRGLGKVWLVSVTP